ncbi:MAG TPA: class II fructose-bisphosphate aldolase [Candidatus Paceibacterota bacterium]
MPTLRELVADAEGRKIALGHFNISDLEGLWGVFNAARKLNLPVIIGTSEGERDFVGVPQAVALIKSLREEFNYPVFLNADHTYSYDKIKEAIDAGYDAVIFDGTKLSFDENVSETRKCVEYARKTRPEVLIEGEIGYIGTSSKILDEIPAGASISPESLTKPEEIMEFVKQTGVDLVAPAVGNLHGMLRSGKEPALNIPLISKLREAAGVPLVLHGGSGTSDEDFKNAIKAGISIVHINTEIRLAYRKAVQIFLQENPDEIAPYKFMKPAVQGVERVTEARLRLFNNL